MPEKKGASEGVETPSTEPEVTPVTPEPEGGAQPEGGETPKEKTYTESELQNIIHERTKGYSEKLEDLDTYRQLGTLDDLAKLRDTNGGKVEQPVEEPLTDEDKRFMSYMEKRYPGLKGLDSKLKVLDKLEGQGEFIQGFQGRDQEEWKNFVGDAYSKVGEICKAAGITNEAQVKANADVIAAIIQGDKKLHGKWRRKDSSCINDAMEIIKETTVAPFSRDSLSRKADTKQKTEKLSKSLPSGGVPAASSKEKKLSDNERVDRAFEALKGGEGDVE